MAPHRRRVAMLGAPYLALAGIWALGSSWLAPNIARTDAGLMALAISLGLALALGRRDDRLAARGPAGERPTGRLLSLVLVVLSTAFLGLTVLAGPVHDYVHYNRFWTVVSLGQDPWFLEFGYWGLYPANAYGPLFNLLAFLAEVNPLAPKLLFATASVAFAVVLVKGLARDDARDRPRPPLAVSGLMAWAWGPYVWVEVAIRGHFDVLVGLAVVWAAHARRRGRDLPCALALAAGTLLKFFPVVLLPFLALDRGRIRGRLLAGSVGLIALGMTLSWLVWGSSTFRPLGFAAGRSSACLSIFRFLRGRYSPIPDPGLDWLAGPALALGLLGAWWWSRARRAEPTTAAVLAVLTTLLLYRNGLPQYQMVLLMVASDWVAHDWSRLRHRSALVVALVGYFAWLSAFEVAYALIGDGSSWLEDVVGLPTFVLGCALAVAVMRSEPGEEPG